MAVNNIDIIFKGKCVKTGKWAYGNLYEGGERTFITWNKRSALGDFGTRYQPVNNVEVDPDSVEVYTGFVDYRGKEIFTNDIVAPLYVTPVGKLTNEVDYDRKGKIVLKFGSYRLERDDGSYIELDSFVKKEFIKYIPNYGELYDCVNNVAYVVVINGQKENL